MKYRINHVTTYRYTSPVVLSHNLVHLALRDTPGQRVTTSTLTIQPEPSSCTPITDAFGNRQTLFAIQGAHRELQVAAIGEATVTGVTPPTHDHPWVEVAKRLQKPPNAYDLAAAEFAFASPLCPISPDLKKFALDCLRKDDVIVGATRLSSTIHRDWRYDPAATTISTPVSEVLQQRAGVCQDFAHLAISALRSCGLAARYVSGYLETDPPPGTVKLRGADASHAWFQIYLPDYGWYDLDPTNDCHPEARHITCAYGRDFSDVSPTRGLILGGGRADISVMVDVDRIG
ncbi:MAG: transglutaminase family protein [Planctomycetota bacterium]|jgi:transglutaminase-like putative cysteine protease|nr:transglutaminase family protein [Planctomycetota bacterium]